MTTVFQPLVPAAPDGPLAPLRATPIDARLSRTEYFDGRLLTAADLIRDRQYLDRRLLDVGHALGDGIVDGLDLALAGATLHVQPGVAVSADGRVLQLDAELLVDLDDRATLATLNTDSDGALHAGRFTSGLYAVALGYAEQGSGSAEVFPRDFGAARGLNFDAIDEGVELRLVPIGVALPPLPALAARALLARTLVGAGRLDHWLPDDAVALGVLAIDGDAVLWCDPWLLRHPRRPDAVLDGFQEDLLAHHRALLAEVLAERAGASFHAGEHFHVLPPAGPLPKACVDPVRGQQTYFPDAYRVRLVPLRSDDMEAVLQSALALAPLDLDAPQPAELLVLVALDASPYATLAETLLARAQSDALGGDDVLAPVVTLSGETDPASPWFPYWDSLPEGRVYYLRRPPRAAADGLAGIVLASGYTVPVALPPPAPVPDPVDPPPSDETSPPDVTPPPDTTSPPGETSPPAPTPPPVIVTVAVLPDWLQSDALARLRPAPEAVRRDQQRVLALLDEERTASGAAETGYPLSGAVIAVLLHVGPMVDVALWPTLAALAGSGGARALERWLETFRRAEADGGDVFRAGALASRELGLPTAVLRAWSSLG